MNIPSLKVDVVLASISAVAWNKDNVVLELAGGKHVTLRYGENDAQIGRVKNYMRKVEEAEDRFVTNAPLI